MENTLENKSKLFALYWGQLVAIISKGSYTHPKGTIHVVDKNTVSSVESENYTKHRYSLELKPLSSISDEDVSFIENRILGKDSKVQLRRYLNDSVSAHISLSKTITIIDYLRSKGYAMTWLGIRVEEQVARGWVKLKGETK